MFTPLLRGTEIELGTIWTVALNRNQNLLGKTMLILNRPSESVAEVEPDEWIDLGRQIRRLRVALDSLFAPACAAM